MSELALSCTRLYYFETVDGVAQLCPLHMQTVASGATNATWCVCAAGYEPEHARTERVRVRAVRRGVDEGRARERDVRGVRAGRVRGHAIGERSFAVTMCLGDGFQHTTEISIAASHV